MSGFTSSKNAAQQPVQMEEDDHIATHIHEFSLYALPAQPDDLNGGSSSSGTHSSSRWHRDTMLDASRASATARASDLADEPFRHRRGTFVALKAHLETHSRASENRQLPTLSRLIAELCEHLRRYSEDGKLDEHPEPTTKLIEPLRVLCNEIDRACLLVDESTETVAAQLHKDFMDYLQFQINGTNEPISANFVAAASSSISSNSFALYGEKEDADENSTQRYDTVRVAHLISLLTLFRL